MGDACVIYSETRNASDDAEPAAPVDSRTTISWRSADELLTGASVSDEPAVLIADGALLARFGAPSNVPARVVVVASDSAAANAFGKRIDVTMVGVHDHAARKRLLDTACRLASTRLDAARLERMAARTDEEFHQLSRIGMTLMEEHDRVALVRLILAEGKELTGSDGAGLLLLDHDANGVPELRPALYDFHSLPGLGVPEITFAVDNTSIVGRAAFTREPVVVADARALSPDAPFVGSAEFRRRYGYCTRSMLAVPMLTHRDELLGVLFVINRKSDPRALVKSTEDADRYVVPYTDRDVRLTCSLASQAALSIENARLYRQVEHMLERFVKAAVSAVDARDPTMAGHSIRVAALTIDLAEAVTRAARGAYRDVRFTRTQLRELHYAALLHDLGKITVREDVLVKAKKLPPVLWERVDSRFDLIHRTIQLGYWKRCAHGRADAGDAQLEDELHDLALMREAVREANEPNLLAEPPAESLADIARRTFERVDGGTSHYLAPDELSFLQLSRGTLDDRERAEIESHVEHTRRFLVQIPWTDDLKDLVTYAYGHLEKLNGTGYPQRLTSDDIPIQTRMITLADIFDALTEGDRPYKPAVTSDKAIEIIQGEARAGLLDRELVNILTESQVYKRILEEDWHRL
jgi:HD-GYP domain-containing protein (c-di-GMP phosphodiesterase class II)